MRDRVLARDDHVCHWCGGPATHADHLVPLALGGPDTDDNLVAACAWCNKSRGHRRALPRQPRPALGRQTRAW